MSDMVKGGSKAAIKRKQRLAAIQVSTVGPLEQSDHFQIENEDNRMSEKQALDLIKEALGKDLDSMSADERYAISLQSERVQDFIIQAVQIRDIKLAQRNQLITEVANLVDESNQWLRDTVEAQKFHYANLKTKKSAEELLRDYTGCASIEEFLSGGDLPGELDT